MVIMGGLLSPTQRFLWEVHGSGDNMVFGQVAHMLALPRPQPCVSAMLTKLPQQCFKLHPDLEAPLWEMHAHGTDETIREAVHRLSPGANNFSAPGWQRNNGYIYIYMYI